METGVGKALGTEGGGERTKGGTKGGAGGRDVDDEVKAFERERSCCRDEGVEEAEDKAERAGEGAGVGTGVR